MTRRSPGETPPACIIKAPRAAAGVGEGCHAQSSWLCDTTSSRIHVNNLSQPEPAAIDHQRRFSGPPFSFQVLSAGGSDGALGSTTVTIVPHASHPDTVLSHGVLVACIATLQIGHGLGGSSSDVSVGMTTFNEENPAPECAGGRGRRRAAAHPRAC